MIEIHFLKVKILSQKVKKVKIEKFQIDCSNAVKVKANVNPRTLLTCENWNKSLRGSSSKPKKGIGRGAFLWTWETLIFEKPPRSLSHAEFEHLFTQKNYFSENFRVSVTTHTPNIKISFHTHNLWGTQTSVR